MKAKRYFIIVTIFCEILTETLSSESDIADFEFIENQSSSLDDVYEDIPQEELIKYDNFIPLEHNEPKKNYFETKEKIVRRVLTKALTNKALRQRFVEIMPILKVLSTQQRLALSALISAQINAKTGSELKLDQVKAMFGDSKKLILPLILDIANLVRTAAKNSLHYEFLQQQKNEEITPIRRNLDVLELADETSSILDAKQINHELIPTSIERNLTLMKTEKKIIRNLGRLKRSADLITESSANHNQEEIFSFQRQKLNTSFFVNNMADLNFPVHNLNKIDSILNMSLTQIEDLALSNLNGTNNMNFSDISKNKTSFHNEILEELPVPESLIARPRFRKVSRIPTIVKKSTSRQIIKPRSKPSAQSIQDCERFTASMCIRADDYPTEMIMGSIRRHKHAMNALLAEYRDKSAELEYQEYLDEMELTKKRRQDLHGVTPGGMCATVVRYARPQKARSATGDWKYIVNTGQHTQTLRLEKCLNPQESCSYLSENYRSRCIQVYNYHRLLSWDKTRGLHVDIFKIPTCCNCYVDGYREVFPPLGGSSHDRDISPAVVPNYNSIHEYSTLTDDIRDIEYEEDDDDIDEQESVAYQFANGFKRVKPPATQKYDDLLQLSGTNYFKNRYEKSPSKTSPTIGAYLSPPKSSSSADLFNSLRKQRRPIVYDIEERSDVNDQTLSGSERGKEVTVYTTSSESTLTKLKSSKIKNRSPSVRYTSPRPTNSNQKTTTNSTTTSKSSTKSYRGTAGFNRIFKPSQPINPPTTMATPTTSTSKISTTLSKKTTNRFYSSTKFSDIINSVTTDSPFEATNHKTSSFINKNRRVNYNYHPIIDFFEVSSLSPSPLPKKNNNFLKRQDIVRTNEKEHRIGLENVADNNNWKPFFSH